MNKQQKIVSGTLSYVSKMSHKYARLGYRIVKQKLWADGKYTLVMEKF